MIVSGLEANKMHLKTHMLCIQTKLNVAKTVLTPAVFNKGQDVSLCEFVH